MKTKKQDSQKTYVINRTLKFEDCKHYLEPTKIENKTNQLEKIK